MTDQATKTPKRLAAYRAEAAKAEAAFGQGRLDEAFRLLERAHVLGQPWPGPHNWTHWMMLRIAVRRRDFREIRGQVIRLAAGGILSVTDCLPIGNTGGANVPARMPMPIPSDLIDLIRQPPSLENGGDSADRDREAQRC